MTFWIKRLKNTLFTMIYERKKIHLHKDGRRKGRELKDWAVSGITFKIKIKEKRSLQSNMFFTLRLNR